MHMVLQLELPADARLLPRTRRAIDGYMVEVGTDDADRADVVLALDEACVNVIRHAFPEGVTGSIKLRADITDTTVSVQVEDDGIGFDPFEVPLREASPEDVSGRGLRMIRHLMDNVRLESPTTPAGGTRVLMEKVLGEKGAEEAPPSQD